MTRSSTCDLSGGGLGSQLMRGEPSGDVGPYGGFYRSGSRRVGSQKGGYRPLGRARSLPLIWRRFSHVQEQRFEDLSLKQCTEMIGGKVGVLPTEQSRCHACG